jgi:hypothetical protein
MSGTIFCTSFDVGYENFAYYTEVLTLDDLRTLVNLQKEYSALKKVQKTKQSLLYANKVCVVGKRKKWGVRALSEIELPSVISGEKNKCTTGVYDETLRKKLIALLNSDEGLWSKSRIIVIEQQYYSAFTKRKQTQVNMNAIKIAEDIMIYFMIKFPDKYVVSFDSRMKTYTLGAPKKVDKIQRKTWSCKKAHEIFEVRKDTEAAYIYDLSERVKRKRKLDSYIDEYESKIVDKDCLSLCEKVVKNKQKLDDVSDAVNQLQAFKFKKLVCE